MHYGLCCTLPYPSIKEVWLIPWNHLQFTCCRCPWHQLSSTSCRSKASHFTFFLFFCPPSVHYGLCCTLPHPSIKEVWLIPWNHCTLYRLQVPLAPVIFYIMQEQSFTLHLLFLFLPTKCALWTVLHIATSVHQGSPSNSLESLYTSLHCTCCRCHWHHVIFHMMPGKQLHTSPSLLFFSTPSVLCGLASHSKAKPSRANHVPAVVKK